MRALPFVLLALLILPSFAQPTAAQTGVVPVTVALSIEDPGRALVPGRNETVPARLSLIFQSGSRPGFDAGTQNFTQNTTIHLSVKQVPSWVIEAHVYPATIEIAWEAGTSLGGTKVYNGISVNLTLDPNAPALQREDVVIEGVAEPNGNMAGGRGENPGVKLRAAIVPVLNVTASPTKVIPGGRWSTVPFTITNNGNYDMTARLNLTLKPENSETRFPESVEIKKGESVTIEVEIRVPWTESELGELELEATPVLADDNGKPIRTIVEVQGQSAVPIPSLAPLAALAILALARRRRA